MKTLGIIGGLGPMATAYFLQLIVEMTDAKNDQDHIEIILHSKPQIPDRTRYILGKSKENPLQELRNVGKSLVEQGAEVIAIPCITAHYFQGQLEEAIECPILHAIKETANYLKKEEIDCVGIMATDGTIESQLFQRIFQESGIACVVPGEEGQKRVMHIIYDNVKAGQPIDMEAFDLVAKELFRAGAKVNLLGCTELSMVKRDCSIGAGFLDVMEVLARQAVLSCGKLKEEYRRL